MNIIIDRVKENESIVNNILSSRSVLYNLEPKGMGTPLVESLTSYISRLASIHNVTVSSLIKGVFAPVLDKEYMKSSLSTGGVGGTSKYINGNSKVSIDYVNALEKLTCRSDILYLTMNSWKGIFPNNVIGHNRKWCSDCLNQMMFDKDEVYEPLIWYVSDINKCSIHQIKLKEECPNCHRKLPFMHSNLIIGYCQYCSAWLGGSSGKYQKKEPLEEEEKFIAVNYQQLIANAPSLASLPTLNSISFILKIIKEELGFNSINKFAKFLELDSSKLSLWLSNKHLPSRNALLKIVKVANSTIYEMICNQNINLDFEISKFIDTQKKKAISKKEIESHLKNATKLKEPKSLKQIAYEEGFSISTAEYNFPSLCQIVKENLASYKRQLLSEKQKEIEGMLKDCLNKEIPISISEFSKTYGIPIITTKRLVPDLYEKVVMRYKEHRANLKIESIEKYSDEIEQIVLDLHREGIYPSIKQVQKRLSKPELFIKEIYRDIWRKIINTLGYD